MTNPTEASPIAWLCELIQEDGTTRQQFVTEDPDGLRWNDAGEPVPYRTTPLFALPVPRWWTCKTHGDAMPQNAWGCPECVREMRTEIERLRAEIERLRAAIKEAQPFQLHIGAEILMAALNPQTGD